MATQTTDLRSGLSRLTKVLRRFGQFRKRWIVLDALALFVLVAPGSLLIWFLLDWGIGLPAWPLFLLFVAVCGTAIWGAVRWLVKPQLHRINVEREAVVIEQLHGDIDNRLIGSFQLGHAVDDAGEESNRLGYSTALVDELMKQTAAGLDELKPRQLVDLKIAKRRVGLAAVVGALILAAVIFVPDAIMERYRRLIDAYAVVIETIFPVTLEVMPGDVAIVRGTPIDLKVHVDGARRKAAQLIRTDIETGEATTNALELSQRRAEMAITDPQADFRYRFVYGGRSSDPHVVSVADRPEVKAINYEMTPPEYTGQPMRMMTGRIGALKALPGTAVLVSFAANTGLHPDMCFVEWMNGDKQRIDISGRFGSFSFNVAKPDRVSVYLTGHYGEGFEMEHPLVFQISPQKDERPDVQLLTKAEGKTVSDAKANGLFLKWFARDDYGIQKVGYEYTAETIVEVLERGKRTGGDEREYDPPRDRVKGGFRGVFANMNPRLGPGDRVTIHVYAIDNNTETGPGRSESEELEMIIVGRDFGAFARGMIGDFGFSDERKSMLEFMESERVPRETDLLQPTQRRIRTEKVFEISRISMEGGAAEDSEAVGMGSAAADYFKLLTVNMEQLEDE